MFVRVYLAHDQDLGWKTLGLLELLIPTPQKVMSLGLRGIFKGRALCQMNPPPMQNQGVYEKHPLFQEAPLTLHRL